MLEIIELRTTDRDKALSGSRICEIIETIGAGWEAEQGMRIKVYTSAIIKSDISIHIMHSKDSLNEKDYLLSHQIRTLLEEWGLVNHTIWKEEDCNTDE